MYSLNLAAFVVYVIALHFVGCMKNTVNEMEVITVFFALLFCLFLIYIRSVRGVCVF